ncbi:PREDICTED: uncharacterized protein LOC108774327 [Cyphomyrmex costatus]|uniref:uncharacterized protein LOC108774327 n=1 Tax=Cyphomyrmex costatus TaxID=456900 RepID=UPI0008521F87|nr:PREDICTED: uncharacterized protein LOC108774327 [Cyphomyrmex costatus]
MEKEMYVVLFFDDSTAAVPTSWVQKEKQLCWWPPKHINLSKAIAKCTPYQNNWASHSFHKLWGPYETYAIAKQAERDSIEWSTANESIISTPQHLGKRVITKSRKVLSNESNNEESSDKENSDSETTICGQQLIFCYHLKKTAAESHRMLVEAYGEHALGKSQCFEWFKKFKSGDFDVRNEERGKPSKPAKTY